MPDLDQIKQGEQEARDRRGRFPKGGRAIPPAGRAAAATTSKDRRHSPHIAPTIYHKV